MMSANATDGPAAVAMGLLTIAINSTNRFQLAFRSTGAIYKRTRTSGTWSAWGEL